MSSPAHADADQGFRPPLEFIQLLRRAKQGGYLPTKKEEAWLADSQPQDGQYDTEDNFKSSGGAETSATPWNDS